MSRGYSAEQTARLVSALRWTCGRLRDIVAAWASQAASEAVTGSVEGGSDHAASAAVRLTVLQRRLEAHGAALDGLQPDSVLLAPHQIPAPGEPALVAALDEIAAHEDHSDRQSVAETVFAAELADVCTAIMGHAASHCDAALSSTARVMRDDLWHFIAADASAYPSDRVSAAAPERSEHLRAEDRAAAPTTDDVASAALRRLREAGGIVSAQLTRPDTFE